MMKTSPRGMTTQWPTGTVPCRWSTGRVLLVPEGVVAPQRVWLSISFVIAA